MERINAILRERNDLFRSKATVLMGRFEKGGLSYAKASKLMNAIKQEIDEENGDLFVPYIAAPRESSGQSGSATLGHVQHWRRLWNSEATLKN